MSKVPQMSLMFKMPKTKMSKVPTVPTISKITKTPICYLINLMINTMKILPFKIQTLLNDRLGSRRKFFSLDFIGFLKSFILKITLIGQIFDAFCISVTHISAAK